MNRFCVLQSKHARFALMLFACSLGSGTARSFAATLNPTAAGAFVAPTGWNRGDAGSAYALWDNSFTSLTDNSNPLDTTDATTFQNSNIIAQDPSSATLSGWNVKSTRNNLITSTQHIYGGNLDYVGLDITVPNYDLGASYSTAFRLQVNTQIMALDASTFMLSIDGDSPVSFSPTVTSLGANDRLYEFSVPGNAAFYNIFVSSPSSGTNFKHATINALAVDTYVTAVPEPSGLALAAVGCMSFVATLHGRRVRRKAAGREA